MARTSLAIVLLGLLLVGVTASRVQARQLLDAGDDDRDNKHHGRGNDEDDRDGQRGNGRGNEDDDRDERDNRGRWNDDDDDSRDRTAVLSPEFKVWARSGDAHPAGRNIKWGQLFEIDNKTPIYFPTTTTGAGLPDITRPHISNNPDFLSYFEAGKNKVKALVQFESPSPSMLYLANLDVQKDGELKLTGFESVDTSEAGGTGGLANTCAGSVTPWNTHIGSEEVYHNAKGMEPVYSLPDDTNVANDGRINGVRDLIRYWGIYGSTFTAGNVKKFFNPYNFGHIWEAAIDKKSGRVKVKKHFSMPRVSSELAYVMPDEKTVYIVDDAANGALYKVILDKKRDLSSGTLYGIKVKQTAASRGDDQGVFKVDWVKMAHGRSDDIEKAAQTTRFSDIFDSEPVKPLNATLEQCRADPKLCSPGCPTPGFREVNNDAGRECLRVRPGKEKLAAFLESRRYVAYVGGTSQFSKWEGFSFDPVGRKVYTAISYQRYGMENFGSQGGGSDRYDSGSSNDVAVDFNHCGCTYIMDVDNRYDLTNMYTKDELCGKYEGTFPNGKCSEALTANADNVNFIMGHDTLILGEDGSDHIANSAWAYNVKSKKLTPLLRGEEGSEVTGNFWHEDLVNGYSYQGIVLQHPDSGKAPVGYMGPYKLKRNQKIEFTAVAK